MPAMNNLVARNVPPALKATALGNCYTGFHSGAAAWLQGVLASNRAKCCCCIALYIRNL